MSTGQVAPTTHLGKNVRGFDVTTDRARGGSRGGISKYISAQVAGTTWVVQELATLTTSLSGVTVQQSLSGRAVVLVAVARGNVYWAVPGATSWTASKALIVTAKLPAGRSMITTSPAPGTALPVQFEGVSHEPLEEHDEARQEEGDLAQDLARAGPRELLARLHGR